MFIGLVVTAVVLVSGCYGPTTSPNATVQPTGGTPVETVTPIETATPVGITTVTETPYANVTGTSYATTPAVTATANMTVATVNAVNITSTGFNPAIISVPTGTTVIWTNRDNKTHTVKGSGFDSGSIDPGATFRQTFYESISYDYGDPSYPNMSGTVIVT